MRDIVFVIVKDDVFDNHGFIDVFCFGYVILSVIMFTGICFPGFGIYSAIMVCLSIICHVKSPFIVTSGPVDQSLQSSGLQVTVTILCGLFPKATPCRVKEIPRISLSQTSSAQTRGPQPTRLAVIRHDGHLIRALPLPMANPIFWGSAPAMPSLVSSGATLPRRRLSLVPSPSK